MTVTERSREHIFWLTDLINRGTVRRHYDEIRSLIESPDTTFAREKRKSYLDVILNHAVLNVPFYRNYSGFTSLEDFPVINKSTIRERQESFFAEGFLRDKLHKVTTSGSTGAPLTIWQDNTKRARHRAENIFFSELAGFPLGSRLYYLRVWNEINRKGYLQRLSQNIVMQDAGDLSDQSLESFIRELEKDNFTKSVLAFSSTFEALAIYLARRPGIIKGRVNCLITISETLPEGARSVLKNAFGCPVISRYSNMENGFLAQQCGDESGEYHLNTSGFYIELLHPDMDEPVVEGETGRVVVTDLFNFAMPIIRYDTGDLAVYSSKSVCGKPGPVFSSVEGRRVDFIYNTSGHLLSPHVITNTMWKYSGEVRQFQFIQNGRNDYVLKLNLTGTAPVREAELKDDLGRYLGPDAVISLDYVEEIPLLASGKRKKIVNNYIKN